MPIIYDEKEKIFNIKTPETSYILGVYKEKYLLHLYYGKRIDSYRFDPENLPVRTQAFCARDTDGDRISADLLPIEYPCYGSPDFRTPALSALRTICW